MSDSKYFLICPGGPMPLALEKTYYFGRAEGNNIVVDDTRASRRHAELYWDGSEFVLVDLNSSNGTLVNNEKITTQVLKDSDEITIGIVSYKYRAVENIDEIDSSFARIQAENRAMATCEMPGVGQEFPDSDFNGVLGSMSVPDICQVLQFGMRSGMLLVANMKGDKGILFFRDGEVISAECGFLQGDKAAMAVMKFKQGNFTFKIKHPVPKENISMKTAALLLEAARTSDET